MPVVILVHGDRNRVVGYPTSWQDLMVKIKRFLSLGDLDEDKINLTIHPDWSGVPLELDSSALPDMRLPDKCRITVTLQEDQGGAVNADGEPDNEALTSSGGFFPFSFGGQKQARKIILTVKTLTGKRIKFAADPNMTVEAFKAFLSRRESIPPQDQRLIHEGRLMEDGRTLDDYLVVDGSIILMNPILRGGKPAVYLLAPEAIPGLIVGVDLSDDWKLTVLFPPVNAAKPSAPKSSAAWTVDVGADGIMFDHATNMDTSCLFWEAETIMPKSSSVIDQGTFTPQSPNLTPARSRLLEANDLIPYLYKCLEALCLTPAMRTDFITFWLPKFYELHQKNFDIALNFVEQAEYEKAARLTFSKEPDAVVRVFMVFGGVPRDTEQHANWMADQGGPETPEGWRDVVGISKEVLEVMADNTKFRAIEWGALHAMPGM